MQFFLFFTVWILILSTGYAYVGWRVISGANLLGRQKLVAWLIVAVLLLFPQVPFAMLINKAEELWLDVWFWAGYMSLGLLALIMITFALRDLTFLLIRLIGKVQKVISKKPEVVDVDRRRFLLHSTNLGLMAASGLLSGYGLFEAQSRTRIEDIPIPLPHLPQAFDGFRIVQFTDLHVGPTIKRAFVERVTRQVMDLKPDLIAFTGDLVDGSVSWLRDDVAPLHELAAPYGKFFITGNHEYYSGANPWIEHADKLGFSVLLNSHRLIRRDGQEIVLAGVTDHSAGDFVPEQATNPAKAFDGAPPDAVRVLLAHQPRSVFEAEKTGFDVQLSGHTHGGQFFPWNYLATLNQPYISGLHKRGNRFIYVNRGTGYWGPPLRLGIPSEITVVTLKKA
ncbi:MAG: Serine/threonine protein phosphatase [Bacteroidetes bacterium]|nr:Serine/threonine protein phosphatase [Bacteroidota bacterium]